MRRTTKASLHRSRVELTLQKQLEMHFSNSTSSPACKNILASLRSPVPHLLGSNMSPSDTEIEIIKKAIERTDSLIQTVLADLDQGDSPGENEDKNTLRSILIAYQKLYRREHQAVLVPIRRIPREILGLIFMEVSKDDRFRSKLPIISRVCRLWRDVILSSPLLWTILDIDLTKFNWLKSKSRSKRFLASLKLYLQCSRNALLEVNLVMDLDGTHPAIGLILESSNRWTSATLTVTESSFHCLERLNGRIENLRKLSLRSFESMMFEDIPRCTFFQNAPLLCEVRLDLEIQSRYRDPQISFPWQQLHLYEEERSCYNEAKEINMMTACRILKMNWDPKINTLLGTDSIVFQNLRVLHLSDTPTKNRNARELYPKLRFPNIRELQISSRFWRDILGSMIRNYPPPNLLRSLRMRHNCTGDPDSILIDLLRLTPYLEELDLDLPQSLSEFDVFASFLSRPGSLPRLHKLTLALQYGIGSILVLITRGSILKITSSRCEPSKPNDIIHHELDAPQVPDPPVVLSLMFQSGIEDARDCPIALEVLERSSSDSFAYRYKIPQELVDWAKILERLSRNTGHLEVGIQDIDEMFSSLIKYEIGYVEHLYRTSIHVYLYRIAKLVRTLEHVGKGLNLQDRACEIVQKWEDELLLPDLPNRRWAVKDKSTWVYIPQDDILRSTNPTQIIYGMPILAQQGYA